MNHSCNCWNIFFNFIPLWLLVAYSGRLVNASQRYPYVLPKCCESDGSPSANGISMGSDGATHVHCGGKGLEYILLPKQLFPAMSIDSDHVEVGLKEMVEGLQCEDGKEEIEIFINLTHIQIITPVNLGNQKAFDGVAFSGDNLLDSDGNIYTPPNFCISSRTTNKTRLAFKTCKQTCSPKNPCIQRCCGGHQSILSSIPTTANESFLDFCSSPDVKSKPWNPWKSNILSISNETHFYQMKYVPRILEVVGHSVPQGNCRLLAFTETQLTLLEDGRLEVTLEDTTEVLENFCIDGMSGRTGMSSSGATGDKCEATEAQEVVVAYVCSSEKAPSTPSPQIDHDYAISLPACFCHATQSDQLIQCPLSYKADGGLLFPHPLVRLTTAEDGKSLDCPEGYGDFTLEYQSKKPKLSQPVFVDGSLRLPGCNALTRQNMFCIRSVFHNAMTVRICKAKGFFYGMKWWDYFSFIAQCATWVSLFLSPLFYVAVAVVYIRRSETEFVLRCGTICYAISMALNYVLLIYRNFILPTEYVLGNHFTLEMEMTFCKRYTFAWMCVLCFDIWFTITFHSPAIKRVDRRWSYVAFTLTLPSVCVGTLVLRVKRFIDPESVASIRLGYLVDALVYGLLFINFILYLTTAKKLWIARHSFTVKPQIKTFLFYSKLLILTILYSVIEFLLGFVYDLHNKYSYHLGLGLMFLMFLHPIVSFFFLIWNEESKRYLAVNYPRVKRVLDFIDGFGYPVRKCWGFCKCCQEVGTNGDEALELFLYSTDKHVHKRQHSGIPL